MPNQQELNQFRRLTGDYSIGDISDTETTSWLDDAANEAAGDLATPINSFDGLAYYYHNEVIHKAAINWWWDQLSKLQGKHSISVAGGTSQNVSEKWQRAFQMIQTLQAQYDETRTMGYDIHVDNVSRFSKQTMRRIGGIREEDTFINGSPGGPSGSAGSGP